jgi:hypothetical protein
VYVIDNGSHKEYEVRGADMQRAVVRTEKDKQRREIKKD